MEGVLRTLWLDLTSCKKQLEFLLKTLEASSKTLEEMSAEELRLALKVCKGKSKKRSIKEELNKRLTEGLNGIY